MIAYACPLMERWVGRGARDGDEMVFQEPLGGFAFTRHRLAIPL